METVHGVFLLPPPPAHITHHTLPLNYAAALYRASVGEVPVGDYTLPIGQAEVLKQGTDITIVGYGAQMYVLEKAVKMAEAEGISCELIDLQTIIPWDQDTVLSSVNKTGRLLISHEAPKTMVGNICFNVYSSF